MMVLQELVLHRQCAVNVLDGQGIVGVDMGLILRKGDPKIGILPLPVDKVLAQFT